MILEATNVTGMLLKHPYMVMEHSAKLAMVTSKTLQLLADCIQIKPNIRLAAVKNMDLQGKGDPC